VSSIVPSSLIISLLTSSRYFVLINALQLLRSPADMAKTAKEAAERYPKSAVFSEAACQTQEFFDDMVTIATELNLPASERKRPLLCAQTARIRINGCQTASIHQLGQPRTQSLHTTTSSRLSPTASKSAHSLLLAKRLRIGSSPLATSSPKKSSSLPLTPRRLL